MKNQFYILLFICYSCLAQGQDYVILTTNDTIYGEVRRGNLQRNGVKIKTENRKQRIHFRDVKEWKRGPMPVVVIPVTKKNRTYYMELLLVSNGKIKLYKNFFLLWRDNYFIFKNDKHVTQLIDDNMDKLLLNNLKKCKSFSEKYAQIKISLHNIEEAVNYYNTYCSKDQ